MITDANGDPARRLILITGASRGIGRALSLKLLDGGSRVVGIGRDFSQWSLPRTGFEAITADLAELDGLPGLLSGIVKAHPELDAVVSNAGAGRFGHLEPQERFVAVAEQLLAVAVAISAQPVLKVLARKIGGGFFGQPDAEDRDSLFAMTLYSVARLATPGRRDAEHCLNELIKSENFRTAHASTTLLALCQVDPQGLVRHLSKSGLRERLAEQFAIYDSDGSVRRKVAQDVLAIVGLEDFKDALYGLDVLDPSACGTHPDDWLVEFLVFAPDAPLKVAESDGEMRLCSRTTPT